MRGMTDETAQRLGFTKPDGSRKEFPDFKYLVKCNDLSRDNDIKEYNDLIAAFINLGFT